ncbi:uridylate-specific endoribonuclease A [Pangasianodon hypophthalmus]|uniref:uridylate-specific endoribonuclease A n=1 Tax=Pangasianodon hypophthalmus TaxID=310915 RepID=UPI000EFDDF27|nr:uridylate-specific endoribonuclease A [Pangasianodon hypophthalmus]
MRNLLLLLFTFTLISQGHGNSSKSLSRASDTEIKEVSEALYLLDSNKASKSELTINPQTLIDQSESSTKKDLSPLPLFVYVDEASLFSKPTYAAFIALLNNYERKTGVSESFSSAEVQEQENFLKETMKNTELGRELFSFFYTKGYYRSWEEFLYDLRMMWFGLYSRSSGTLDSSGFEHTFSGEIKNGIVSGFHNWVRFYLLEKSRLMNYYSHSYDGPWTSYPDVLGMQFMWDGYYKQVGSALIGSSPEFDLAVYTLCYVTRPGQQCRLSLGGKQLTIQTYTWDKVTYGNGKKYIASAYPVTP